MPYSYGEYKEEVKKHFIDYFWNCIWVDYTMEL